MRAGTGTSGAAGGPTGDVKRGATSGGSQAMNRGSTIEGESPKKE